MAEITAMTEETIREMYGKGLPPAEMAAELNLALGTVYGLLSRLGLKVKRTRSAETVKKYDEAMKAYTETDEPATSICRRLGLSYNLFYLELGRRGVPARGTEIAAKGKPLMDRAVEMYQQGEPGWKITQETGVQNPRLYTELHKRGIPLRVRSPYAEEAK